MIATTPMPPTIRPTLESAIITRKNAPVIWFQLSSSLSWVTTSKLFSSMGRSARSERMSAVTSSMASCTVADSTGLTRKLTHPRQWGMYLSYVLNGSTAAGRLVPPKMSGGGLKMPMTSNGTPPILMVRPIGSSSPKNSLASLSLITATRAWA